MAERTSSSMVHAASGYLRSLSRVGEAVLSWVLCDVTGPRDAQKQRPYTTANIRMSIYILHCS